MDLQLAVEVFVAAFLGNLLAWWWVFKRWRFPKIVYIPVNRDNKELKRLQAALRKAGGDGTIQTNELKERLNNMRKEGLGL